MLTKTSKYVVAILAFFAALFSAQLFAQSANAASAPLNQVWTSSTNTTGIYDLEVGNGKIWAARSNGTIAIFNASTGAFEQSISMTYTPYHLSWDGNFMWVTFNSGGVAAKISSSYVVTYSSAICTGSGNDNIFAAGGRVFMSCWSPTYLYELNQTDFSFTQTYSAGNSIFGLRATATKVYLDMGSSVRVLDATNFAASVTTISASFPTMSRHTHAIDSNYYWQVGSNSGAPTKLLRVKLSDNTYTVFDASVGQYQSMGEIASDGSFVYLPNVTASLLASFDIANSTLQTEISGSAQGAVTTSGGTVFAHHGGALFAYSNSIAQTVTWAPNNTSNFLAASPVTPSAGATSSGPGAITYAVVGGGGTGCTVDANTGVVAATALGVCTVRATAAASGSYASAFLDVQFSFKTTQTITWAPTNTTNLVGIVNVDSAATSDMLGIISYAVQSAGTTGCAVNATPSVQASSTGVCVIRATGAATSTAFAGYVDVTFTFTSTQSVTWNASNTTNLLSASPVTPNASASSSGPGAISYSVQSAGTAGCTVNTGTGVVSATTIGVCTIRATAAAATYYPSSYVDKVFTFQVLQTITWNPTTTILATGSPVTVSSQATSSGPGEISYWGDPFIRTSGCTVDSATGAITASSPGTCGVVASVASATGYVSNSTTVIFTLQKAQTVVWTPGNTQLQVNWSPYTGTTAAMTDGSGGITYTVQSAGATGCGFNSATRTITYTAIGYCVVRATAGANGNWLSGYVDVTFTIVETQFVLWGGTNLTQSSGTYTPSLPVAFANNGSATATGAAIVYSVASSGTTGCTVDSATGVITWTSIGQCRVSATAQAIGFYIGGGVNTSNFNFYADQTVTWVPTNTTNSLSAGAVTPNVLATSSGPGAITYSMVTANAACSLNTSTGAISANARTRCYVRASASASGYYNQANSSLVIFTFTVPQTMTWAVTNLTNLVTHSVTPDAVPVRQGGPVTYSVVTGGTATCNVNATTGVISASTIGTCIIRATSAAAITYELGTIDKIFTFVAGQLVTWAPTNTTADTSISTLTPDALASGAGGGAITYTVQSAGTTGCQVNSSSAVLTFIATGSCVIRATAAAAGSYVSDYVDLTFNITAAMSMSSTTNQGSISSGFLDVSKWKPRTVLVGTRPVISLNGIEFGADVKVVVNGQPVIPKKISDSEITFALPALSVGTYSYVVSFTGMASITFQDAILVIPNVTQISIPKIARAAKINSDTNLQHAQKKLAKFVQSFAAPVKLVCTTFVAKGASAKTVAAELKLVRAACLHAATKIGINAISTRITREIKTSKILKSMTLALEPTVQ